MLFPAFVSAVQEGRVRKDVERQKTLISELITKNIPEFLNMMEKVLVDNGGEYLVGSEVKHTKHVLYIEVKFL